MKTTIVVLLLVTAGCSNQGYYGDTPAIQPKMPSGDVVVEHESGDMICVTENGDAAGRTCVPKVH